MSASDAELRKMVDVHSVAGLEKFPFKDYAQFQEADRQGRVEILTAYDAPALAALSTRGQQAFNDLLLWSSVIVIVADIALAIAYREWSLLFGIPLAIMGMFLALPGFMRTYGLWLNRLLIILTLYSMYSGAIVVALLLLSYLVPNYLTHAARHHCRMVFVNRIKNSELALVYLLLKGILFLKPR